MRGHAVWNAPEITPDFPGVLPIPPSARRLGINLLGMLQSEKGVGEACRSTLRSLTAAGIPFVLNNWVDPGSRNLDAEVTRFSCDNPYAVNLIHLNADITFLIDRTMPYYRRGRYNIGYWNWELEWFPETWQDSFAGYDEIWAPSRFTADAIRARSPIPVHVVPFAITVSRPPRRLTRTALGLSHGAFIFFFAFDFESVLARKNPLAVIRAFRQAFGGRRDVMLVVKMVHPESKPMEYAEVVTACAGCANITLIDQVLARDEMLALVHESDAYVSLHRSEGYGLVLAEAMALGKPVIATGYSANLDFMNDGNSLLVRHGLVEVDQDYGPYRRGALWAELDVDDAAEKMIRLVENRDLARALGEQARRDVKHELNPHHVGGKILGRLQQLSRGRRREIGGPKALAA